ncbi:MAG: transcriptional regulator NrdR [Planctomycetota bacterium]
MQCPFCHQDNDRVVDTRPNEDGSAIRRRRECLLCERRFTTYERLEEIPLRVVKKSGERVPYDRANILKGIGKALEKRPVSAAQMEAMVEEIEREILNAHEREVPSRVIGEMVMERLRVLDEVAYVRFASVYREFKEVDEFVREVHTIARGKRKTPERQPQRGDYIGPR